MRRGKKQQQQQQDKAENGNSCVCVCVCVERRNRWTDPSGIIEIRRNVETASERSVGRYSRGGKTIAYLQAPNSTQILVGRAELYLVI